MWSKREEGEDVESEHQPALEYEYFLYAVSHLSILKQRISTTFNYSRFK